MTLQHTYCAFVALLKATIVSTVHSPHLTKDLAMTRPTADYQATILMGWVDMALMGTFGSVYVNYEVVVGMRNVLLCLA